mgnify:CR=1 FL=1
MDFLNFIQNRNVVLLDGAIGTELDKRGLMGRGRVNLDAPDAVLEIQQDYARSGAHAITANTLTMNRIYIETHNVGVSVKDVNRAGVEIARKAVGEDGFVLGNVSSTGQLLEPYGDYTEPAFCDTFTEQARILADAGADALLIETMIDLSEALCALRACKEATDLPVLVSMAFSTEQNAGRTVMGNSAADCAKQLQDAGADVIGANCGSLDPQQTATVISLLASATSLPLLAQPNAGKPRLVDDRTLFDMGPEPFAEGIAACLDAGAKIVGGCCGTTPDHIRAVRRLLDRRAAFQTPPG